MVDYSYERAISLANTHDNLFQYSSFNALKSIIENKSLLLSRIDNLNDTIENEKIVDLWKGKVFVSCFTYRENESLFFWKAYSKGENDGIRFSFKKTYLENCSFHPDKKCEQSPLQPCKKTDGGSPISSTINSSSWGVFDFSILDVMYVPRNCRIENVEMFQGRFKYSEWDLEYETRLRVALRPKNFEQQLSSGFITPNENKIYMKLSNKCLQSMTITLSPWADEKLSLEIDHLLKDNCLDGFIKPSPSVLTNELKIAGC